ncbi:MAG: cyclic nucleotide-binding domain-containing protein [Candidatus Binatia bacterium]
MELSTLRTFPVLRTLTNAELADLFGAARELHFPPGTVVCHEGAQETDLYFLVLGRLEVAKKNQNGTSLIITQLHSGAIFGELSWILGTPRGATLTAREETFVIRLDGPTLTRQVEERSPGAHKFNMALLRLLASRLAQMNEQILELQSRPEQPKKSEIERLRERMANDWTF